MCEWFVKRWVSCGHCSIATTHRRIRSLLYTATTAGSMIPRRVDMRLEANAHRTKGASARRSCSIGLGTSHLGWRGSNWHRASILCQRSRRVELDALKPRCAAIATGISLLDAAAVGRTKSVQGEILSTMWLTWINPKRACSRVGSWRPMEVDRSNRKRESSW